MTTSAKIRLLLALVFASLLLTAIIVQQTYTPKNNLYQTAQTLEDNLHKKENFVNNLINDKASFEKLKNLENDDQAAFKTIKSFTTSENIWVLTFKGGQLVFWSGIKVIPGKPASIHEGNSFIKTPNGYYEAIKKSDGAFSAIFFIPVKTGYPYQNQYLQNTFAKNLLNDNNIGIADFTDRNIYEIHSSDHTYLFSVKVKQNAVSSKFFYFELAVWLLCIIVLCLFVQNICSYIVDKGYLYFAFILLGAFIVLIRYINLKYSLPDFTYKPELFNPQLYNGGPLYPSLGDFCINIISLCWFFSFIYIHRLKLLKHILNKFAGYAIVITSLIILAVSSTLLLRLFYGLVINSQINFDVNNVLNLSIFSIVGVLMLCFAFLMFYLLIEIILTVSNKLPVPVSHQLVLTLFVVTVSTVIATFYGNGFTVFYIMWGFWVLIRGFAFRNDHGKLTSGAMISIILLCSVVSSIKLNNFQSVKERDVRKGLVQKLEKPYDPIADEIFRKIEKPILTDGFIKKYFTDTIHNNDYLKNHFKKIYFDGYLSKYDIKIHEFNERGKALS
ncbi:MAG: hypothetical protein ABI203_06730, partial [Mucilaginibacter sp.]